MNQEPPEHFKKAITEAHSARGSIMNSYAQVEFLLADLASKCRVFLAYESALLRFPYSAETRARTIMAICELEGPLKIYARELKPIAERLLELEDDRHFFAHGFGQLHHSKDGRMAFQFRRFDPQKGNEWRVKFRFITPDQLQELRSQAADYADKAFRTFERIYRELELENPWPKQ